MNLDKGLKILVCPVCKNEIKINNDQLECRHCNLSYNIVDDIPNMLPYFLEDIVHKTVEQWENLPYNYEDQISRINKFSPETLELIDKPMINNLEGKVLEIGCGTARLAAPIEKSNYEYFGLEPALKLLQQGSVNSDNLICGVGEYLPFKDNSFDTIIGGYHSFRYIDLQKGFKECARVLKPDGKLIFSLWNYWYINTWVIVNILTGNVQNFGLIKNIFPLNKKFIHNDVLWINKELNKLKSSGFETKSILTTKKLPIMKNLIKTNGYWTGKKGSLIGRDIIFICQKTN